MNRFARIAVVIVVVAAAIMIVITKREREIATTAQSPQASSAAVPTSSNRATILLFADLREADDKDDPCALIIQTARSARESGMNVTEIPSGASPELRKQYKVVVDPTVIVISASGNVIGRHEGEDVDTVEAVRRQIEQLASGGGRA